MINPLLDRLAISTNPLTNIVRIMQQRQNIQVEQGNIAGATDFLLGEQGQPSAFGNTDAFVNIFGNVEAISADGDEGGQSFGNRVPPGGNFGNNSGNNTGENNRKLFQSLISRAFGIR